MQVTAKISPVEISPAAKVLLWSVVLLGIAVRVALASGTDVYFDEAYYHQWSQALDWSYFDHPPMIAWLISVFGVRGTSLVCGFLTIAISSRFAFELRASRSDALAAAALVSALPFATISGVWATPDSPFALFWVACLWMLQRRQWLWAGVLAALCFLSKYPAVLLGLVFLAAMLAQRKWENGALWTLPVGALGIVPVVVWNAQHEWISFRFQANHGLANRGDRSFLLDFILGQFAMAGPLLLLMALVAVSSLWRRRTLLAAAVVVPLLFFGAAAFRAKQEANWAAIAWVAGAVLISQLPLKMILATASSNIVLLGLASSHILVPIVEIPNDVVMRRSHGWSELQDVQAIAKRNSAPVAFAPNYQLASEVAYYGKVKVDVLGGRISQYDLWPEPSVKAGENALWVAESSGEPPAELTSMFDAVEKTLVIDGKHRGRVLHSFHVWVLKGRKPE